MPIPRGPGSSRSRYYASVCCQVLVAYGLRTFITLAATNVGLLLLLCATPGRAHVCTPLNRPAFGPFPAVVNGIDGVDWGVARIQWTTDATANSPATAHRIRYATAAQWAARRGTYPQTFGLSNFTVDAQTSIAGGILPNLQPETEYHVVGESSQDGTWCSSTDATLTTHAYREFTTPEPPAIFDTSEQFVTGKDYIYGADCKTVQDCFNKAKPGDGIGLPPGVYPLSSPITTPGNRLAKEITSIDVAHSAFQLKDHGFKNGQKVLVGADYNLPSPINGGVVYEVANATADQFQLSLNGTVVALVDPGFAHVFVMSWPMPVSAEKYIVIHTTSQHLPPWGVRLDPVAYGSQLAELKLTSPAQGSLFQPGALSGYYYFKGIVFSTGKLAMQWQMDPPGYLVLMATQITSFNQIYDRCWFHPAPPPDRIETVLQLDGRNVAMLSSVIDNDHWWQPARLIGAATKTPETLTFPAGSYDWVKLDGTKGVCEISQSALTFAQGTGSFISYINPIDCRLHADVSKGISASGSAFTLESVAHPSWPVDGAGRKRVLLLGSGDIVNGKMVNYEDRATQSEQNLEGSLGVHLSGGPGPVIFDNNTMKCSGICGVFASDDMSGGSPCGDFRVTKDGKTYPDRYCTAAFNPSDLTETRNSFIMDPITVVGNPAWTGGYYSFRNGPEIKQMHRWKIAGNIIGPIYTGIAGGGCAIFFAYSAGQKPNVMNYTDSSEGEFANNTCFHTGSGLIQSVAGDPPAYPQKHILAHNNLFFQLNGYEQGDFPKTLLDTPQYYAGSGLLLQLNSVQDFQFDHNTVTGQGGTNPFELFIIEGLTPGLAITNNLLEMATDSGFKGSIYTDTKGQGGSVESMPSLSGLSGSKLLAQIVNARWTGNVVVATYSSSNPKSLSELTSSQRKELQGLYPSAPDTFFLPGASVTERRGSLERFKAGAGADMAKLEAAQGKVSDIHAEAVNSTSAIIRFLAPDSFGCPVDWGANEFWKTGTTKYTRVKNGGGQRAQQVELKDLPPQSLIFYRLNCQVMQATGSLQLK